MGLRSVWSGMVGVRAGKRPRCALPVLRVHIGAEIFGPNRTCCLRAVLPAPELEGAQ